ncbi:hypothetical protein DIPPA_04319 [Diplonema papillatum]|nr:hypothetical protein DIPPA_04319 [Diplonema papillatum]
MPDTAIFYYPSRNSDQNTRVRSLGLIRRVLPQGDDFVAEDGASGGGSPEGALADILRVHDPHPLFPVETGTADVEPLVD